MSEACRLIFKSTASRTLKSMADSLIRRRLSGSIFASGLIISTSIFNYPLPCTAQLPGTNMGQFVHQPGDNQYTVQTQMDRHPPSMPASAPISAPASASPAQNNSAAYRPTPAAPKPDVSLLPVVADEPIKPAGFPPLPDRLDLPVGGASNWAPAGQTQSSAAANVSAPGAGIPSDPTGVHQHYVHYNAGAFMPAGALPQNNYRPSSADYYNVNPNARASAGAIAAPLAETPSAQALKNIGPAPQLAGDAVTRPEAPTAVTTNQSVTQDLSLPEDDFNKHYPTNTGNSAVSRNSSGVGRMLVYPLRNLGYSMAGMAGGMAGYGAMYMYRR